MSNMDNQYIVHCIVCLETNKLSLIPHRREGRMVGLVFACPKCEPRVLGRGVETVIQEKE